MEYIGSLLADTAGFDGTEMWRNITVESHSNRYADRSNPGDEGSNNRVRL
jgi:hypothetical protein